MAHTRGRTIFITAVFASILLLIAIAPGISTSGSYIRNTFNSLRHGYGSGSQLSERLAYAEKLWRQSVDDRLVMFEHVKGRETFIDIETNPFNVWDFSRPSFFCPHDLERVGTLADGGKWVCGMSKYELESPGPSSENNTAHTLIVYSFGVNVESSFEAALLQRTNAEIWGYDYSVDHWASHIPDDFLPRAHFNKIGLGRDTDLNRDPPFYSIQDLMKKNGHDYIDLVKMDIEGAEFEVVESLIKYLESEPNGDRALLPIGQLLIEIHLTVNNPNCPRDVRSWMEWFGAMERLGLRPVNNEDNWIGDALTGHPTFMEYTMINAEDTKRNVLVWE